MKRKIKIKLVCLLLGIILVGGVILFRINKEPDQPLFGSMYEMKKCDSTIDMPQCIKVEADCCDCDNITINKKYESYWKNKLAKKCEMVSCVLIPPSEPNCFQKAGCINNKCQLYD